MSGADRKRSSSELDLIKRVKKIAAKLPEVDVVIDGFGHTTFKVAKKPFVIIGGGHDDTGSISIKADTDTQRALIKRGPYTRTPYIGQHGWVSLMDGASIDWSEVEELITDAFWRVAPKKLQRPRA